MEAAANPLLTFGRCIPTPDFNIAIIYDDVRAASRAVKICHRLIEVFNDDFLFNIALCDANSFEQENARTTCGLKTARRARLVFLAMRRSVPHAVWQWLGEWERQFDERPVGVAVLDDKEWSAEALERLENFCGAHNINRVGPDFEPAIRLSMTV